MSRQLVYNTLTDPESLSQILPENIQLRDDFLEYLKSVDRAPQTITAYYHDLNVFFVYNLKYNGNKRFTEITKREFVRFQNHALTEWKWSPSRLRSVKSAASSLSNFIENILDEEPMYANYRPVIGKIASPASCTVREKTVFDKQDIQNLLDYLVLNRKYMQAAAVALCISSGRRKSEIPRFKTSFFNPENVLFDSLYKTPEKIRTKGRGKTGKMINVYVIKNSFDPYLNLWLAERNKKGVVSEWLFPSPRNPSTPLSTASMDDWSYQYTEFLGKNFYWHSLRHYFTTELARNNIPANIIQDMISWESADMVKLYTDISVDENLKQYFDTRASTESPNIISTI